MVVTVAAVAAFEVTMVSAVVAVSGCSGTCSGFSCSSFPLKCQKATQVAVLVAVAVVVGVVQWLPLRLIWCLLW